MKSELERIAETYEYMAREAKYRPAAPGDRMGNTDLTVRQLADSRLLREEAMRYACEFTRQEEAGQFWLGVIDNSVIDNMTNRAVVLLVEAIRVLAGGPGLEALALHLVKMAEAEVRRQFSGDTLRERSVSPPPYGKE